jgi:hypothetical protein
MSSSILTRNSVPAYVACEIPPGELALATAPQGSQ